MLEHPQPEDPHQYEGPRQHDSLEADLIQQAWTAVVGHDEPHRRIEITGTGGALRSRFGVEEVALACVGSALLAADALHRRRGGPALDVGLNRDHVATAVRSERFFRPPGFGFAPLSRFWPTVDGWVLTHANYPWHRAALLSALGMSDEANDADDDVEHVAAAIAERQALGIEEAVFAAGGVAAAVRSRTEWQAHPQGQALATEGLIGHRLAGNGGNGGIGAPRRRSRGDRPASGVRVLDLTRVIAGPVCTRFLGALGADVLRLDPPHHLDLGPGEVADTLLGKRSALLDFRSDFRSDFQTDFQTDLQRRDGERTLHCLLDDADIVVCGYRPGALDRFGLSEDDLAERHPGVVVVSIAAWGHSGPWARRRGFDSIVQAATGIAIGETGESADRREPGALPCQLLDHGTGYLAAAVALDGLRRQPEQGGTHAYRLSLARTAGWLTAAAAKAEQPEDLGPQPIGLVEFKTRRQCITAVLPPGRLGGPLKWPFPPTGYGDDAPVWRESSS